MMPLIMKYSKTTEPRPEKLYDEHLVIIQGVNFMIILPNFRLIFSYKCTVTISKIVR